MSNPTTGLRSPTRERTLSRSPRPIVSVPSSKMLVRTCRMVSSMSAMVAVADRCQRRRRVGRHALEGETDGEEALDDRVVQVPGQPIPFLVDGHLLDPLVQSGIFDGDAGRGGQSPDQRLIVAGELRPAHLVGEIEVAVDVVAYLDRYAEERGHRGMVWRKPVTLLMSAEFRDPQCVRIGDQQAEDPPAGGPLADSLFLLGVEPDGDELGEGGALIVEHSEGAVAGIGHRAGLLDDVPQQRRQLEVGLQEQGGFQNPAKFGRILNRVVRHGPSNCVTEPGPCGPSS